MDRGIREVCDEALHFLRGECELDDMVYVRDFVGYFDEIRALASETEKETN